LSKTGKVTQEESLYRLRLHQTPDIDYDLKKAKTSLIAPACLVAYGCIMPVVLIVYYVIPYQTGAGLLQADGSLDWYQGEVILALSSAALYIPLGLISAHVIWKRYSPEAKTKDLSAKAEEI